MALTVNEIMNRELLAFRADLPAGEARELLRSFSVSAAPVIDEGRRPLGVVSMRDLLPSIGTAEERMSRPARCVGSSMSIEDASRQLARSDLNHLVVVDATGLAVGMVSSLDLLRAILGMPTRHPATFPHWDEATEASWTDDLLLDEEGSAQAPDRPGVLVLSTGHLGERDSIVWAESCCGSVRTRARELALLPREQPAVRLRRPGRHQQH